MVQSTIVKIGIPILLRLMWEILWFEIDVALLFKSRSILNLDIVVVRTPYIWRLYCNGLSGKCFLLIIYLLIRTCHSEWFEAFCMLTIVTQRKSLDVTIKSIFVKYIFMQWHFLCFRFCDYLSGRYHNSFQNRIISTKWVNDWQILYLKCSKPRFKRFI